MITVYDSRTCLKESMVTAWKRTIIDIKQNRWLIWSEFKKDFLANYKQSGLGSLWAIVLPLIPVSAYLFLGYVRVLNIRDEMPFVVFIISGMTFWQLIAGGINSGTNAIHRQKTLLSKINMPLIVVFISKYGHVLADTLIRLIFLAIVLSYHGIYPGINIILLPFVMIPPIMFSLGLGMILSLFNCINSDVGNITNALLTYGMFVSSVIFSMPTDGFLGVVDRCNVLGHFVKAIRGIIVYGRIDNLLPYLICSAISLVVFANAVKWQHTLQYKIKNIL
jgi:lipopolysaccharide transport system permease protein